MLTNVAGVINSNTTWNLAGSPYKLTDDVFVRNGATLTIDAGVQVSGPFFTELYVSDNGSGGVLNASGAIFDSDVVFGQNGTGSIQNSTVSSKTFSITSNASPNFSGTSFHGGSLSQGVRPIAVYPEYVPNLAGQNNSFGAGASIGILGGVIDQDTQWPKLVDAATYEMLGDVFVRNNAALTIAASMTLYDSSFVEIYISDDGSGGVLNADSVTFDSDVIFGQNATGTIQNSSIAGKSISVNSNASPNISNSSFYNGHSIVVYPEFVPQLIGKGNTFGSGAIIGISGGVIDQDTLWPNIADASTYEMLGDVFVRSGATLTIAAAMTLYDSSFVEIYISDDGSGGVLNANGVTFDSDVFFGQNATGTIQNSSIAGKSISIGSNASPIISNSSFYNGRSIVVYPEYVPQLSGKGNTFGSGAIIGISGGVIDQNTLWPNIADAATYEMLADVFVRNGATLTIGSDMSLLDSSFVEIYISDDGSGGSLNADRVTFDADVIFGTNSSGLIQNSSIASHAFTVNTGGSPNFFSNTFHNGVPVLVFPEYVPRLVGNQFNYGATVGVLAGQIAVNTTWPVLPGVTKIALFDDVHVTSDAALTIAKGLVIESQSTFVELYVGALGFGGALNAAYVVLDTNIVFGNDSAGTIENSRFVGSIDLAGSTQTTFTSNHFGTATVVRGIRDTLGTVDLSNNYWGTNDAAVIEAKVDHQPDDNRRPLVLYEPFLLSAPPKANPVITWPDPADIFVGTALSSTQLNATADTTGTFVYSPPAGVVPGVGNGQTLQVTFTPSNTLTFNTAIDAAKINVVKRNPVITWNDPADITFGTPLGSSQLNATADVPGTFVYSPPAGTVLSAATGRTLTVTFTPSDAANFNTVIDTATINVDQVDSLITWNTPADIVFGTVLSATQLNATANNAGSFVYTPPLGTLLNAGQNQMLNVAFTPNDAVNFTSAQGTIAINVLKADPVVNWADPAPIEVGTALGDTQFNATANLPGAFTYVPAAGTLLAAGTAQRLNVRFTPDDLANYNEVTERVDIDVLKIAPTISWNDPADIVFGTPLGDAQLNATTSVPGSFVYTPAAGTILDPASNQILSATFTPDDNGTFDVVTVNVGINVLKADPVISWIDPADITFGTPLGAAQLNATADVPGTFQYLPGNGISLDAGPAQNLQVEFTPDDQFRFNIAVAVVQIDVLKADPILSWDDPGSIILGTPLGSEQLDASADVAGTFTYDPVSGAVLSAGDNQVLNVTFVPDDGANFNTVTSSVTIDVLDDLDYGDAPESYRVTLADDGPRHLRGSLFLGGAVDRDADGQFSDDASGDDQDAAGDDEDGFTPVADIVTTTQSVTASSFLVSSSGVGKLDAWIDFNGNGTFEHPDEHLGNGTSFDVVAGQKLIKYVVPAGSAVGDSFIRLRISSGGGLSPSGPANDGEVEDHAVTIRGGGNTSDVTVDAPGNLASFAKSSGDFSVREGVEELFRAPADQVNSINLPGSEEDDHLTLDFIGGSLIPAGGLKVDGKGGQDVIHLVGPGSDLDLTDPLVAIKNVEVFDLSEENASVLSVDGQAVMELSPTGPLRVMGGREIDFY